MYYYINHYFQKEKYTMSDNKLLTENTIRRFMKLANTEPLADNFLSQEGVADDMRKTLQGVKIGSDNPAAQIDAASDAAKKDEEKPKARKARKATEGAEEEDTLEEDLEGLEEQEEDEEMEIDAELDADMDAEPMDAEPEMGAADMSLTEEEAQLLISLGERLSAAMGEAAPDDEMDAGEPAAMDDMEDMDSPEGEEEPPGMGGVYRQEENIDQEELVNEVLKRVTKRLVAAKLKNRK